MPAIETDCTRQRATRLKARELEHVPERTGYQLQSQNWQNLQRWPLPSKQGLHTSQTLRERAPHPLQHSCTETHSKTELKKNMLVTIVWLWSRKMLTQQSHHLNLHRRRRIGPRGLALPLWTGQESGRAVVHPTRQRHTPIPTIQREADQRRNTYALQCPHSLRDGSAATTTVQSAPSETLSGTRIPMDDCK